MRVHASKATARLERPQFSERAVFEALVNAVGHRDYSMAGARVRLHMFGDRLELYVPGSLANTLTPDSMQLAASAAQPERADRLAPCALPGGSWRGARAEMWRQVRTMCRRRIRQLAYLLGVTAVETGASDRTSQWRPTASSVSDGTTVGASFVIAGLHTPHFG